MMDMIDLVKPVAEKAAGELGFELFDLRVVRSGRRFSVIVTIDRSEGNVTVSDCEQYSRALDVELDKQEEITAPYDLVVQSPGAERPLRSIEDFKRFSGSYAKLVLKKPVDNRSFMVGKIESVEDGNISITEEDSSKVYSVSFSNLKRANLKLRF